MQGPTIRLNSDGNNNYYDYDIENFQQLLKQLKILIYI
jgi:hypothetical protein